MLQVPSLCCCVPTGGFFRAVARDRLAGSMDVAAVEPVAPVVSIQRPVLFSLRRYVYIDLGWWVPVDTWDRLCTWFTDFRFAQRRDLLGDLSADGDSIDPGLLIALNQTAGFTVRQAALEGFLAHLAQRLLLNRQFSPHLRASQDVVRAVTALISVLRSQVQRHEGGLWLSVAETSERISDSRVRVHDRAGRCVHPGSAPGASSITGYGLHKGRSVSLGWTAVAPDYWAVEQGVRSASRVRVVLVEKDNGVFCNGPGSPVLRACLVEHQDCGRSGRSGGVVLDAVLYGSETDAPRSRGSATFFSGCSGLPRPEAVGTRASGPSGARNVADVTLGQRRRHAVAWTCPLSSKPHRVALHPVGPDHHPHVHAVVPELVVPVDHDHQHAGAQESSQDGVRQPGDGIHSFSRSGFRRSGLDDSAGRSEVRVPLETRAASRGGGGDRASWFGFRRATAEDGSVDLSIHSGVSRYVRGVEVVRAEAAGLMEAGWSALRRKSYSWSNPATQRSRLLSLMGTMDAGQVLLPLAGRVGRGIYMPYDCNGLGGTGRYRSRSRRYRFFSD